MEDFTWRQKLHPCIEVHLTLEGASPPDSKKVVCVENILKIKERELYVPRRFGSQ
jgi:hypothetical protein